MNLTVDLSKLVSSVRDFVATDHAVSRCLALYSAAVTVADEELLSLTIECGTKHGVTREQFYEIVLQSYLFLGFPRMLIAADTLNTALPSEPCQSMLGAVTPEESNDWFDRGQALYRKVYGDAWELLRRRVEAMAPEVFRWMVFEGYGKVLSRSGLDMCDRELSIIAFLMMENRPKQLHSHIRGALNVGVPRELVLTVMNDIGAAAGSGYSTALAILEEVD